MPERHEPPDPQAEQTARLLPRPDAPQQPSAPPAWGQQPEGAGWGPPPSGGRSRRVPVAAAIAAALLVIVAIGAAVVVRGVRAVRTVASSATTAPAPFAPGTGNGNGGGTPGGSGAAPGGGSSQSGGSVRLPDQVDGLGRLELNDPGFLDGRQGMLDMVTRTGAIDGWGVGAYGHDASEPAFVLLVVKAKEASAAGMLAGAMTDSIRNSLGGDLSEPTPFARDGVRYDCSKGQVGNLCSFQDGALIGIGFGRGGGLERLSRLTADARHGVRS
jgi:hypothetical protein